MKIKNNIIIGIIIGALTLGIFHISSFALHCTEIRSDVIRLHVLANSDSDEDQALKLKVRDAVLEASDALIDDSLTIENAKEKIIPQLDKLRQAAIDCINQNGYSYDADIRLCYEYFDTRTYSDSITLPAGKYLALKLLIGEGKGKNWWCVIYPSLCLPAASEDATTTVFNFFSKDESEIIVNNKKYKAKLKIVEYIEKIKNNVDNTVH